jgi:hypothetical protein
MSATVLTLRQGNVHRVMPLSDRELRRLENMGRGYTAMVRALKWIAANPNATTDRIRETCEDALLIADGLPIEVPFDG